MFRFTTVPTSVFWPELARFTEKIWSSIIADKLRLPYNWVGATNSITLLLQTIGRMRSEEHTSELQSRPHLVCRLLLEKKKKQTQAVATDRQLLFSPD